MHIHVFHFLKMSHSFEYLKYWIHTNIIYFNHNTKFMKFMYELMKFEIPTKFVWTYEA
jgi:hypothetical protein